MSAARRDDIDTPRPCGKQVAVFVDLHPVGHARFSLRPGGGIEEGFPVCDGAIRIHVIDHPDGIAGVGVADVEFFLVRGERDAIGGLDILCESVSLPSFENL
jgi:hypothetical protein